MKKMIMILILITLCEAHAEEISYCDQFEDLAHRFMQARQNGYELQAEPRNQMEHEMMLNAWQWPGYNGKMMQNRAIRLFSQDWAYACVRGYYPDVPETLKRKR